MCGRAVKNIAKVAAVAAGAYYGLGALGVGGASAGAAGGLSATVGDVGCYNWTGTMRLDSDLPNWSVTINATCADAGKGSFKVIGTMSGNE